MSTSKSKAVVISCSLGPVSIMDKWDISQKEKKEKSLEKKFVNHVCKSCKSLVYWIYEKFSKPNDKKTYSSIKKDKKLKQTGH